MAQKDQTPNDLGKIRSPTSQLNLNTAIRRNNQDAVKRRSTSLMAHSAQHERTSIEAISPNIDSAKESSELHGGNKGIAVSAEHQSSNLQVSKKMDFVKKYYEEEEDSRNKGLAELKTGEGDQELTKKYGDLSPSSIKETALSKKLTMADKDHTKSDLDKILNDLAQLTVYTRGDKKMNELVAKVDGGAKFMTPFVHSSEITCPESSTKIDPFKHFADLDKLKTEEDTGYKGLPSKTELGEKEMKKADTEQQGYAGVGHVPTTMEEQDQEIQAVTLGGEEGQETRQEARNKEDYMKSMDSTIAVIFYQYENYISTPTFCLSVLKFNENMYGLIHRTKAYFKKDQHGAEKISVLEWLKGHAQSNEDREEFEEIKAKAGEMATKLSSLLVTLMVFMLETKVMAAKLLVLKSSIKWLFEETDSMVTRMIVSVLKNTEYTVIEKRKLVVDSRVVAPVHIDLTETDQFERVILLILGETQHLDYVLMQQLDSNASVTELMYSLKAELNLCEKELDTVESVINDFKVLYGFNSGTELDALQQTELEIDTVSKKVWQYKEYYDDEWQSQEYYDDDEWQSEGYYDDETGW